MPSFEILCKEKFLMRTVYRVEADTPEAAEALVRDGKVAYVESWPLDDPGELVSVQQVVELPEGDDSEMSDEVTPLRPR